ncbi:MAG: cupin protein [Myxococcaceae bacterium]|nr:cupin protein [Myxococcaceae bacterium]
MLTTSISTCASLGGTYVLDTSCMDWVPAGPGLSFKPLRFFPGNAGWAQLLRLEPGTVIPRHRHTGEVHAYNLSGHRLLIESNTRVGPGTYVHEAAGDVDSWEAVGDEPCLLYVEVHGTVEYLQPDGAVAVAVDGNLQRKLYEDWCAANGPKPEPLAGPQSDVAAT